MATHNNGQYLEQCLRSLLRQSLRRLQVIVVDQGSTDGTAEILTRLSTEYRRIKVISLPEVGLGAARNAGVDAARAPYLTFVNPQDTVPPGAFGGMVRSLRRSGSDFVVGAVQSVRNERRSRPAWVVNVHRMDRAATRLDEFPVAMQDTVLFNKVFRRSFWKDSVGAFAEDNDYGDLLNVVTAYTRARSFDILTAVTYSWHHRLDHASIVQERFDRKLLEDRLPILTSAWEIVSADASAEVASAWLGGVLDFDFGAFAEHAVNGDTAYQEGLEAAAAHFFGLATPQALDYVRVDRRLRVWLARQGRWSALEQSMEFFRLNGAIPPTKVVDGRVLAELPYMAELGEDVPDICLELSRAQTALSACVQKAFWNEAGLLVVEGWAFIRGIDLSDTVPVLEASLVDEATGRALSLSVEPLRVPAATGWANQGNQSFDTSAFRICFDVAQLPSSDEDRSIVRTWTLHVRNVTGQVERSGPVLSFIKSGIALRMRARDLRSIDDVVRYVPMMDPHTGFALQVRPDRVRATRLSVGPWGQVSGLLRIVNPIAVQVVAVRATSSLGTQVEVPVTARADGSLEFSLRLPVGESRPRRWSFRALGEDGRRYRVSWPDEPSVGREVRGAPHDDISEPGTSASLGEPARGEPISWLRSSRGFCDLATDRVSLQAGAVEISPSGISVEVESAGLGLADLQEAQLRSPRTTVSVSRVAAMESGRWLLQFPSRMDIWGTAELPLPVGSYSIYLPEANRWCGITDDLLEHCPSFGLTELHGFTISRTAAQDRLVIALRAPLTDSERGRYRQRQLASWYGRAELQPRDAVLFQCFRGEFATDSQRAIHEELRRRESPLTLLWAVANLSVSLPEGAVPLLIGSRAWYEAVGSSRYLCQNIDYDRFFRKRPYQRYLQTFHGYPWKSMGVSLWRAQGKSESLIAAECERRNSAWDSIVVPAPFCEELYRREYRYPHEVLVTGYPRDDSIVTSDAPAVRAEVLARLGISADKTVVLYAPTWRDTVATGAWTAKMFDALNLDRLTKQLGDDYALLLRGHNYNLREGSVGSSASVLDVSSYPEINDLIVAADVAIADYSSLRFDWLLTRKPLLFFVPDLADYLSARTALFEYGPTAPGPMLTTTDEVLAALRSLPQVTATWAGARETFNHEFQRLHDGQATSRVVDRFFGADAQPASRQANGSQQAGSQVSGTGVADQREAGREVHGSIH